MSINKIKHPESARFLSIYEWQIEQYGYASAVVIAYIEFAGRLSLEGEYKGVAQAKIVGEVFRYVGRDAVSKAIKLLVANGVVKKFNPIQGGVSQYSLDIKVINNIGMNVSSKVDVEPSNVYIKEDVIENIKNEEVCNRSGKSIAANCWQERDSGIVTWNQADIDRACEIERKYEAHEIKEAALQVSKTNNDALPSFVERNLSLTRRFNAAILAAESLESESAAKAEVRNTALVMRAEEDARVMDFLSKLDIDEIDKLADSVINKLPVKTSWQTSNKIRMNLLGREVLVDVGRKELLAILTGLPGFKSFGFEGNENIK